MIYPVLAFWNFVVQAIIQIAIAAAVTAAATVIFRKKPERSAPAGKEAFDLPTAEEGRPYPVVFGTRRVTSPNAVTPLLDLVTYYYGSESAGYSWLYYISIQFGICQANIDGIIQIWGKDTCLWPTLNDPTSVAADGVTSIANGGEGGFELACGWCWGGGHREGGAVPFPDYPVHVLYGEDTQTLDSYIEDLIGPNEPPSRGFTSIVVHKFYIGTGAYLWPWSFLCKRVNKLSDGEAQWYIAKAPVGTDGDLNAIHILRELLTSSVIGLGKNTALMGDSFVDAADTCYDEGIGLSCVWDWDKDEIEDMVQQIEQIISGKLYRDPETGLYEIALIRDDYDEETLESFDESDFWVESMACSSPGKVPSRTKVWYWDRVTLERRPAYEGDLAMLWKQGSQPVIQELDFSNFVCQPALANQIAAREQQAISALPRILVLRSLRTMAHLKETDVIKISYADLGLTDRVVRVAQISRGSLADGQCILRVVEDVFRAGLPGYGTPPGPGAPPGEEMIGSFSSSPSSSPSVSPSASASEGTPSASASEGTPSASASEGTPSASASSSPSA